MVLTPKESIERGKQRAEEAILCLKLSGHNPSLGLFLNLGCGAAYLHPFFLKNEIEAIGLELVKRRILKAKKNVPQGNFVLADGCNLPFKEQCFNTIVANDVLEHVPYENAKPLLNEVHRTLNENGMFYGSVANKYELTEPHTLIPFLTWFPRPCWNTIHKLLKKRPMLEVYPYTFRMLKKYCRETNFDYKGFTWLYASKKMSKIDYIGNRTVRKIAQFIKKIGLSKQAQILAEKVSVIVFVCRKI